MSDDRAENEHDPMQRPEGKVSGLNLKAPPASPPMDEATPAASGGEPQAPILGEPAPTGGEKPAPEEAPVHAVEPAAREVVNAAVRGPHPAVQPPADKVGSRGALMGLVALLTVAFAMHLRWLLTRQDLATAVTDASAWISALSNGSAIGLAVVFGPFLLLFGLAVGALVHFGLPRVWPAAKMPLQLGVVLGGCLAAAWFIGTTRLEKLKGLDWLFFVPVVPPALLALQAFVSWRQRPRSVGDFRIGVSSRLRDALRRSEDLQQFEQVHLQLQRFFGGLPPGVDAAQEGTAEAAPRGSYTPMSVAAQFALPGLLLLLVSFGAMVVALDFHGPEKALALAGFSKSGLLGIRWGVAGAFAYVLFTFGARSFRNDLTVGAATWAVITLIVGPTLAAVLAMGWSMSADDPAVWQRGIVLFFAGVAPERVMAVIEVAALKLLKSDTDQPSKLVPLTKLPGVGRELAARLREENIQDVRGLAYADPIRLVQMMPYDLRQVVDWIDQAYLATALPDHYEALMKRGVTGAIDLGWRWLQSCEDPGSGAVSLQHRAKPPESFEVLAPGGESQLIYDTAKQMFYEEHVRLLWVMYNCFSTTATDRPALAERRGKLAGDGPRLQLNGG